MDVIEAALRALKGAKQMYEGYLSAGGPEDYPAYREAVGKLQATDKCIQMIEDEVEKLRKRGRLD